MKFFFLIICSVLINAKVIKHESINARLHDYTFAEFCETMKAKSNLLASPIGQNQMECFNEKFKISDFCLKKLPIESSLSRGFANVDDKKIYCEEASSVMISLTCDSIKNLCKNPFESCEKLKKIYAANLEISNASHIDKNINCYYSKKTEEDLNEI